MNECTIEIVSGGYRQIPATVEGITWETARAGEPAKLTFTVIKDDKLAFGEGSEVNFLYGNTKVFSGLVFEKSRDKDHHIQVTCLDRTFYFKNKENYAFTGVRADQIIARIAADMGIRVGELANTQYVIPKLAISDKSMFEAMQEALDLTMIATGELYCLYDDFGYITLKHMKDMRTDLLITFDTAENFDYKTTIDDASFNYVVVKDSKGNIAVAQDTKSQKQWGVIQHVVDVQSGGNLQEIANNVLRCHNRVARSFNINGALGDIRVRAGSSVYVYLDLGDHICNQTLLVDRVTHTFDNGHHSMELTVIDGRGFYNGQ